LKSALLVAVVNKSSSPAQVRPRGGEASSRATECWTLTAPSLAAKTGVQFERAATDERLVPGYAAVVWKFPLK
jgi:hypothetical protein